MSGLKTPLFDWHVAHGGRMVEFGGWQLPVQYTGVVAEHQAVRSSVGLFDISHMGRLSFDGPDSAKLIQHVWTNDVETMGDWQVRYGLMCNEQGGIHDDVLVYRWPYGWSMVVNAANREKIVSVLNDNRTGRQLNIQDQTLTTGMLAVQGPKAVELCDGLFNFDAGDLKYYHAMAGRCRDQQCVVSRTGYTGEDGLEIMIAAAHMPALADELVKRGAIPCGLGARDTLRLEASMPLYGHELDEQTNPLEAGLTWAVKLNKTDFIGRSSLLAAKEQVGKTGRQRVGLMLDGRRAARENCPVLAGETAVGRITSGSFTPTLERSIAMAYVDVAHASIGTKLTIDIRGNQEPATVVPLPFYKRPKP